MMSRSMLLAVPLTLLCACGPGDPNLDASTDVRDVVTQDVANNDTGSADVEQDAGGADVLDSSIVAGDGGLSAPTVPDAIRVPTAGLSVLLGVFADGVQIYTCTAMTPDAGVPDAGDTGGGTPTYAWVFTAPEATLYQLSSHTTQVGMHGAGPFWATTADASRVVGTRVASANSPTGSIPWLLLSGGMFMGTGPLSHAQYIHRVATTGGTAPSTGCDMDHVGMTSRVPYTAEYYFYGTP